MSAVAPQGRDPPRAEVVPLLRLERITRHFPGVLALDRVDFDLRPGEVHVLIGTLDRPEDFVPTRNAFVEEKLPWLHLAAPA